jgi:hypothetical protein
MHGAQQIEGDTRMKRKTLGDRARHGGRSRRRKSLRAAKTRPARTDTQYRAWSLLLPPGYPIDPR